MIQFIADAEPTATTTPAFTAILVLPGSDTLIINAYPETRMVTAFYTYTDGGRMIREMPVGHRLPLFEGLRQIFSSEVAHAKCLGYEDKNISVWSCDPWDLISALDAGPSF